MDFNQTPRVYLTLRCNYNCSFCVLKKRRTDTISGAKWIKILNAWPGDAVILAGGEPTLHPDFMEIVNGLKKERVLVYSNLSVDQRILLRLRKSEWYTSFHPACHRGGSKTAIRAVKNLQGCGHTATAHINEASPDVEKHVAAFSDAGLKLGVEKDLFKSGLWTGLKPLGEVVCTYPACYFGPDGKRYICVAKMETGDPTGLVPDARFPVHQDCDIHGQCNACDVRNIAVQSRPPRSPELEKTQAEVERYGVDHWLKNRMWESVYQSSRPWHLKRLAAILENAKGGEILDVACATGEITEEIRKKLNPRRVVGYEGSRAVMAKGRELHPDVEWVQGLVESMPFRRDEFDSIHAGEIIEHIQDPDKFVADLARVTRKQLIITTPTMYVNDPAHIALFSETGFRELLERHFESVSIIDAERTFVAVCEGPKAAVIRPVAVVPRIKPRLVFVSHICFDVLSGYVTQTMYQLEAMAQAFDVTYAYLPRNQDDLKYWHPIEGVTLRPTPSHNWKGEGRKWVTGYDLVLFRHYGHFVQFESLVPPDKALLYVSGTGILTMSESQALAVRGVVMQGGEVNQEYLARNLPIERAMPINCTVPVDLFALDKPVFLVTSSITRDKGLPDIIEALEPLKDKIRLIIIGTMLPEHVKLEAKFYSDLRVFLNESWAEWIEGIPPVTIPLVLNSCIAAIHFNRMKGRVDETLQSTKLLEAMAAGKPVIAYGSAGTLALLGADYPYLANDRDELRHAAEEILLDPDGARAWGLRLQERARKQFDVKAVGREWGRLVQAERHLIWLTTCQFDRVDGAWSQTVSMLRAIAGRDVRVDVVFAPAVTGRDLCPAIEGVSYYPSKDPLHQAEYLFKKRPDARIIARGLRFFPALFDTIPKENLYAYLYGGDFDYPEAVETVKAGCRAVITQECAREYPGCIPIPCAVDVARFKPNGRTPVENDPPVIGYADKWDRVIPHEDMPAVLHKLDIFVTFDARDGCSEHRKYLVPMKLIEAVAAGLPVVAARRPGTEMLLGRDYPHLVDNDDEMKAALAILIGSEVERKKAINSLAGRADKHDLSRIGFEFERIML